MEWSFSHFGEVDDSTLRTWQWMNEAYFEGNPAMDSRFIGLLLKYYGDGDELIGFCSDSDQPSAAAIVKPSGFRQWTLFHPSQMCFSPFLHSRNVDIVEAMQSLIKSLPSYCLRLRLPKIDPKYQELGRLSDYLPFEMSVYGDSYLVELVGDFEQYWLSRSRNLRMNAKRWLRRIENSSISMELQCRRAVNEMDEAVIIHANLESEGWKGRRGTAIGRDDQQGSFYREVLISFAKTNEALTYQLYFDGQPVASMLAITGGGIVVVLKIAHNEAQREFAPGRLIDFLSLRDCFTQDRYKIMDMYTRAQRDDLSWGTQTRKLFVADLYRSPRIEQLVKCIRGARSSVLRAQGKITRRATNA